VSVSGVRVEALLPRGRAEAWEALADFERWPSWCLGVRALSASPPAGGVGAERRLRLVHGASHRERITSWDPPASFALRVLDPPLFTSRFEAAVSLHECEAGTRLVWTLVWAMRFGAAGRLFERLVLAPVLRLALRVSLARLARRLRG
jgi:hypothetical protein